MGEMHEESQKVWTSSDKINHSWDIMGNMVTTVKDTAAYIWRLLKE